MNRDNIDVDALILALTDIVTSREAERGLHSAIDAAAELLADMFGEEQAERVYRNHWEG
jgi:hypothetical protein